MNPSSGLFILMLALAAFGIRFLGLLAGDRIRLSRHAWMLQDLPGLIVISLVAASLAGQSTTTWAAAVVALLVAWFSNHVIVTMGVGVIIFALLNAAGI